MKLGIVMRLGVLVAILGCPILTNAEPLDNPDARRDAARRLLALDPVEPLILNQLIPNMAMNSVPPPQRAYFVNEMRNRVQMDKINDSAVELFAKYFTLRELEAQIRFEKSPEGTSIRKKRPDLEATMQSVIYTELDKAASEIPPPGAR